jgi:hypothetical protein
MLSRDQVESKLRGYFEDMFEIPNEKITMQARPQAPGRRIQIRAHGRRCD